jgi:hypothetical protein
MQMTYCPFCGEKYDEPEESLETPEEVEAPSLVVSD